MTVTLYHKLLRMCALTLALVLLFVSGILSPITSELSRNAGSYVAAAIGMQASVTPTEINTVTAQLEERNRALTQREIAVNLKENAESSSDLPTYILSVLLFILLVLITLNYVLDYVRAKDLQLNAKAS